MLFCFQNMFNQIFFKRPIDFWNKTKQNNNNKKKKVFLFFGSRVKEAFSLTMGTNTFLLEDLIVKSIIIVSFTLILL